jgi:hypothetical protein
LWDLIGNFPWHYGNHCIGVDYYKEYCSNECWSLFNNNVLINPCYISKSGFGCDNGIHYICISPYNSQANGIVECRHLDIREAIMKVCNGKERKWPTAMHTIFWAEQITTHKALNHSTYYIVHGVKPLLPFDLTKAMYMVLLQSTMTTTELVAVRATLLS